MGCEWDGIPPSRRDIFELFIFFGTLIVSAVIIFGIIILFLP